MPIFLLDENVHEPDYIIKRCADANVEVIRVHQIGLNQTRDDIIFQNVLEHGYVFVTGNIKDFRNQAVDWIRRGGDFAGAIWLQPNKYRNTDGIIRKIIEVSSSYADDPVKEWWLD